MEEDSLDNVGDSSTTYHPPIRDVRSESLFSISEIGSSINFIDMDHQKASPTKDSKPKPKSSKSRTGMIAFVYLLLFSFGVVLVLVLDSNMEGKSSSINDNSSSFTTPTQLAYTINMTTYYISTTTTDLTCGNLAWIGDGFCDDGSNIEDCDYDGGDCCLDSTNDKIIEGLCYQCTCHLDGKRHQNDSLNQGPDLEPDSFVLLVGGTFSYFTHAIDPTSNELYSLPTFPHPCNKPVGYFTNHSVIVCAGKDCIFELDYPISLSNSCYILDQDQWKPMDIQVQPTFHPASINIQDKLWIIGGGDGYIVPTTTTEYLDLQNHDGFRSGPDLPIGLKLHCVTRLSDSSVMVIGGYTQTSGLYDSILKNTFVFDFETDQWRTGPPNLYRRGSPGCATFKIGNEYAVVTTGGYSPDTKSFHNSTELLLPQNDENWELGPDLPLKLDGPSLVTLKNDVYSIGGELKGQDYAYDTTSIFKLVQPKDGKGFQWEEMPTVLLQARSHFSAIKVPVEYLRANYVPLYF